MSFHAFTLSDAALQARGSGALWWPAEAVLTVSDLHLGKSARIARRGGTLLPPYETRETLARLDAEIEALDPATVVCLGDSFDDLAAAALPDDEAGWLARLMAGRRWIWIEGNHDPGPLTLGGTHLAELRAGPLVFRHIARAEHSAEISGHYHPKARLPGGGSARPCFLIDGARVILPAFGCYTGGLETGAAVLDALMGPRAVAVLCGPRAVAMPMRPALSRSPRSRPRRGSFG
ncbi:ligase-associated DNA damage response endonuclease PdeM [Frigidibacter sp. MR17.24]|uniref:ligase-associated DNA damage response endonuclease PdeM n=1 Tax=Frigidibacter sp. MR17.24 TaxID=3127345 RepID=UPI0030129F52